jgi:lipid II:glycine glycyltransferase (peptidoglycan interpeptide bridge formation enzyme)
MTEKWHALINNYVAKREGSLRIVFIYKDEEVLDNRIKRFRDKAERVLNRTDFDEEFSKVIITVESN